MRNLCMTLTYDGTAYYGFQSQPDGNTIQDYIEKAIFELTGEKVKITGSGRTDAGVHARRQIFNFHTSSQIPVERWCVALNSRLPSDIVVIDAIEVPLDFHSRYEAKRKTYRYTINANQFADVFSRRLQYHHHAKLDIEAMQEGLRHFIGTYDFTTFASRHSQKDNHVRSIYEAWLEVDRSMCRDNPRDQGVIHIYVTGNGFLQHMVRIMVGTLLQIGEGKRKASDVPKMIAACDRAAAGPTAVSHGLMLWDLEYKKE